jgi:MinD superfamily P-loop ATPase
VTAKVAVASGKGGTGKTTVAVALALAVSAREQALQFLDCDVEEPNAAILLKPKLGQSESVVLKIPQIDQASCTGCGKCREICRYNAVAVVRGKAMVFEKLCHACGGCLAVCPEGAVTEREKVIGRVETGERGHIRFMRGILNVGEPMATPVIRALKAKAEDGLFTLLDAPPGTACPVVNTVKDSDYCLLVTEPTPFGLHDLDLMVLVVEELGIPSGVVINKDDEWSVHVEQYASRKGLPILMRIPFSRDIAVLYSRGTALNETDRGWDEEFYRLYKKIENEICQSQLS